MTSSSLEQGLDKLLEKVGHPVSKSHWFEVTQVLINQYADVSRDHQWIHVDPERAKRESPYGDAIAHGNLTLALIGHLPEIEGYGMPVLEGKKLGINYGFNRIRFPAPVPVGSFIRSEGLLKSAVVKGDMIETVTEITVEVKGNQKPACVAEKVGRIVF